MNVFIEKLYNLLNLIYQSIMGAYPKKNPVQG